jgi:hypothetical protein
MFRNGRSFALAWALIFGPLIAALPFAHYVLGWK